jgi:hypothetical protein
LRAFSRWSRRFRRTTRHRWPIRTCRLVADRRLDQSSILGTLCVFAIATGE